MKKKKVFVNLSNTSYKIVRTACESLGFKVTDSAKKNILFWCDQGATHDFVANLRPWQICNHFPGTLSIARKVEMIKNLEKMKTSLPSVYTFYPKSFILPVQFSELKNHMKDTNDTMIIKPDRGSLGRGIVLVQNPNDVDNYNDLSAIVQTYIEPFLIDGLKFDLRIYALVTSVDPLRIYIHEEGLARFCTEPYEKPNSSNLNNCFSHLTNYSLNKKNSNFQSDPENGHKRSMTKIFEEISKQGFDTTHLKKRIDEIIRLTIASVQPLLSNTYRSCVSISDDGKSRCFEILGFDILIDDKANPWLLEVNHMPMLDVDTELDKVLKMSVITGALKIVGLKPNFKKLVLITQKKLTQRRIWACPNVTENGSNINQLRLHDVAEESEIARTQTNWRLIFPLNEEITKNYPQNQTTNSSDNNLNNDNSKNESDNENNDSGCLLNLRLQNDKSDFNNPSNSEIKPRTAALKSRARAKSFPKNIMKEKLISRKSNLQSKLITKARPVTSTSQMKPNKYKTMSSIQKAKPRTTSKLSSKANSGGDSLMMEALKAASVQIFDHSTKAFQARKRASTEYIEKSNQRENYRPSTSVPTVKILTSHFQKRTSNKDQTLDYSSSSDSFDDSDESDNDNPNQEERLNINSQNKMINTGVMQYSNNPFYVCYAAFPPHFINRQEETERMKILTERYKFLIKKNFLEKLVKVVYLPDDIKINKTTRVTVKSYGFNGKQLECIFPGSDKKSNSNNLSDNGMSNGTEFMARNSDSLLNNPKYSKRIAKPAILIQRISLT
ncbi:Tubulin-tyrosine ligase family protein [Tritrichomonas foetus]|uniref:Tubulin-tyrosine ligase family protein n=1 Tax=Tritrichomonas foetus TaxID=1144522 RepID=A0A1J4KCT4_9EUKA|nr:Tubulin-tyrosine ligase family protein [Tritrichomonas foetus]|eukprot:OHT09027.1 Tubulin-tyrosine ligase family protein [Tritrichomonas foetus]